VKLNSKTECSGNLQLSSADVNWHLSIEQNIQPRRLIVIDGKRYEFTDGFADLHTLSYQEILNKKGFTTIDVKPSIDIVEKIRNF
jgi:UDP-N-acetyl-2-amino-2-deoxyglucuronate dehydrogenase